MRTNLESANRLQPQAHGLRAVLTLLLMLVATGQTGGGEPRRDRLPQGWRSAPLPMGPIAIATPPDVATRIPYNLHVGISADLINQFLARPQSSGGPIRDSILGADVVGRQTTLTQFEVVCRANPDRVHVVLMLNGTAHTETVGVTQKAAVSSVGRHRFRATKEVVFDGTKFATKPAEILVDPQNHVIGASTSLDGVPVLGNLAGGMAVRAAERRRPKTEAIARDRLSGRILPEFNTRIDRSLATANRALEQTYRERLEQAGVWPVAQRFFTSSTQICFSGLFQAEGEPTGVPLPLRRNDPERRVRIYVHESLLNNLINRLQLEGTSHSEAELREIGPRLRSLWPNAAAGGPTLVEGEVPRAVGGLGAQLDFTESDPLRVSFQNGGLTLVLRAGFSVADQTLVSSQVMTIPLSIVHEPEKILFERGKIDVRAIDAADAPAMQPIRENLIRARLEAALPRIEFPRRFTLPIAGEELTLTIAELRVEQGWLLLELD